MLVFYQISRSCIEILIYECLVQRVLRIFRNKAELQRNYMKYVSIPIGSVSNFLHKQYLGENRELG